MTEQKIQNKTQSKDLAKDRKKRFQFTVGMKLFTIIFCCVVLPVMITSFVTSRVANNVIESNSSQAAHEMIQQTSEKIDATLVMYEMIVNQILTNLELHDKLFFASDDTRSTFDKYTAQREIQNIITQITLANSNLSTISIIGFEESDGAYSTSSDSMLFDDFDRETPWFQRIIEADRDFVWMHTQEGGYTGASENGAAFALGKTFRSSYSQQFVILLEIKHNLLNDLVDGIKLSPSSEVYITNRNNQLLQATDRSQILTEAKLPLPENERGVEIGEDGNEHIVVSHHSPKADWYVVGTAPIAELTEDMGVIRYSTTIIMIVSILLAVVVSILVTRSIGGPLQRLNRLMIEGAKGNLNVRTNFKNRDEIGQVGRSFNEMMENIKELVQQTNQSAVDVLTTAQELSSSARETAHSAREISEATEQIASGATTLASEAERGNELVIDLSQQLEQVVAANRMMGEVASDVHRVSEQGTQNMAQLTDKTEETEKMTRRMVEKVDQLKERTASIRDLLVLLTQITQQTNILALNASIEAARTGAAGRGFMVIAGEIRNLADESRKSIDVVAEMIEHIQSGIDETVTVMSEAYPKFQEQIASVKDADEIFNSVREKMVGLVEQADRVTESIEQLEKVQQVLSDTMSSVSAVSEESSAISEEVASSSASQLHTSDSLVRVSERLESLSNALTESLKKFYI